MKSSKANIPYEPKTSPTSLGNPSNPQSQDTRYSSPISAHEPVYYPHVLDKIQRRATNSDPNKDIIIDFPYDGNVMAYDDFDNEVDYEEYEYDTYDDSGIIVPDKSIVTDIGGIVGVPQDRVALISDRIQSVTKYPYNMETVPSIAGDKLQAAAYSDQYVRITQGLEGLMEDDELAYIISHEVAHLEHKDHQRRAESVGAIFDRNFGALDKLNSELKQRGWGIIRRGLVMAFGGVAVAGASYVEYQYGSRKREEEADMRALEIMTQAGYNPDAAPDAMKKLFGGRPYSYTLTESLTASHPEPTQRVRYLEKEARNRNMLFQ